MYAIVNRILLVAIGMILASNAAQPIVIVVQSGASVVVGQKEQSVPVAVPPYSMPVGVDVPQYTAHSSGQPLYGLGWLHRAWDHASPLVKDFITQHYDAMHAYVKRHAWELCWKGSVASYIYINYRLFRSITYLLDPERWMYWHNELSLAQLLSLSDAELLDNMVAVITTGRAGGCTIRSHGECIALIRNQIDEEIAVLERYSSWARCITIVDNVQRSCGMFCEGYFPKIAGFSLGCIVRIGLQAISIKHLLYLHEGIVRASPEYLRRLYHLKRFIAEYAGEPI